MSTKSVQLLKQVFTAFMADPMLLPPQYHQKLKDSPDSGLPGQARIVADYIAGMTDRYALLEHQRLFSPQTPT